MPQEYTDKTAALARCIGELFHTWDNFGVFEIETLFDAWRTEPHVAAVLAEHDESAEI